MSKTGILPLGMVLVLALALVFFTTPASASDPPKLVSVQLAWKHQFEFAGFYAAIAQGFYRERGLEVELREYRTGMDVGAEVLSGRATFGITNSEVLIRRLQGDPVVLLANYFKRPPLAVLARPGIHSLRDLHGKRLMASNADLQSPLLRTGLAEAGLQPHVNVHIVEHSFDTTPLIRAEIDAMTAFLSNDPFELNIKGIPYQIIELSSYVPGLGDGYLFTTEYHVNTNAELTHAFIEATNAGWNYALNHPETIIDLIRTEYAPQLTQAALRYEVQQTRNLMQVGILPVGVLLPARIELAATTLLESGIWGDLQHLQGFIFDAYEPGASLSSQLVAHGELPPLILTDEELQWLEAHPRITLGISDQFAPAIVVTPDGRHAGFVVDYLTLLNQQLGNRIHLHVQHDWSAVTQQAMQRDVDGLASSFPNPLWDQHFLYTDPITHVYFHFYTRTDEPAIHSQSDLAGLRVGYLGGLVKLEQLLTDIPDLITLPFASNTEMVNALLTDQVDALVATTDLEWWRRQHANIAFRMGGTVNQDKNPLVMSIRNDWPQLVGILNKALRNIPRFEREQIDHRWLGAIVASPPLRTPELILSHAQHEWLKAHPVIRYTQWNDRAPIEFVDAKGQPWGMSADYLCIVTSYLGLHLEFVPTDNWVQALEYMRTGKIDLLPTAASSAARSDLLAFTNTYLELPVAIFAPLNAPFYGSLEALSGESVAVISGTVIEEWLRHDHPDMKLLALPNAEAGMLALERNEAAALVDTLLTFSHVINRDGTPRLRMAGITPYHVSLAMAVRHELTPLVEILDLALAAIPTAERQAIEYRWMSTPVVTRIDYRMLWQVLTVVSLILATMLYWNWRLSRTQAALTRSEAYYRTLISTMAEGVLVYGRDGLIRTCNAAAARLLNQPKEALIGRAAGGYLQREDGTLLPKDQHPALVSLRTGSPLRNLSLGLNSASGERRWILLNSEPLMLEADNVPDGALVTFTDVTERVQAEQCLRASQARYDEIVRLIPVGLYTLSQRLGESETLEYLSPRGAEILGLSDVSSNPPRMEQLLELIYPEDRKWMVHLNQDNIREDFFWEGRVKVHGKTRWCRVESVAAPQSKEFCLWQGVISDITAQKEIEAAFVRARQEAEAANRAKSDFLANMSHEIRTPMNAVLGMLYLCLETNLHPRQRGYLEQAQRAAQVLLSLLNDILDLSKIEAGKLKLEQVPFSLSGVLADLNALISNQAKDKGLSFTIHCDAKIPDALLGDPLRLGQVLINLSNNAVKFTECGAIKLIIEQDDAATTSDAVSIRFAVHDTGIGIDAKQLATLFQPFHQADSSTTRHYGGTGLGLSICKHLIELMHGNIVVCSQPDQGSIFSFTLSFARIPASTHQDIIVHSATQAVANFAGRRILLVEDNPVNRDMVCAILERAGIVVTTAEHGLAALAQIETNGIQAWDLILMDIQMPELDGLATTQRIRARIDGADVPIIALSAHAHKEHIAKSLAVGMNAHLVKPINPPHLFQELARWLMPPTTQATTLPSATSQTLKPPPLTTLPVALREKIYFEINELHTLASNFDTSLEDQFIAMRESLQTVLSADDLDTLARYIDRYRFQDVVALLDRLRERFALLENGDHIPNQDHTT